MQTFESPLTIGDFGSFFKLNVGNISWVDQNPLITAFLQVLISTAMTTYLNIRCISASTYTYIHT